jgi:hypothetical protein
MPLKPFKKQRMPWHAGVVSGMGVLARPMPSNVISLIKLCRAAPAGAQYASPAVGIVAAGWRIYEPARTDDYLSRAAGNQHKKTPTRIAAWWVLRTPKLTLQKKKD